MADTEIAPAAPATTTEIPEIETSVEEKLSSEVKAAVAKVDNEINEAEDALDTKILKQIEFYFGDANLPNDKFIKAESANNEGWFPLEALLKFNRVLALIKYVPEADRINRIVQALRPSIMIDVDEKAVNIRRNLEMPLPEGNSCDRTVYLKGFHRSDTTLDELIEFYSKYDGMDAVFMRKYKEKVILPPKENAEKRNGNGPPLAEMANVGWLKKFKGSIFLVFKTVEQAQHFVKQESHSYGGEVLLVMLQTEYREKRKTEYEERQALKKKSSQEREPEEPAKIEKAVEDVGDLPKGALLKIIDIPNTFTRELLKEKFYTLVKEEDFEIAFIDFQRGDTTAVLRFEKAGSAEDAFKLIPDAKLAVGEEKFCPVELFSEEDEKSYFIKIRDNRMKLKRRGGSGGGRGFGRGGRGRGRGGGRGYAKRGRR